MLDNMMSACDYVFNLCFAAGEFFLVAIKQQNGTDAVVGFVCGTLLAGEELSHESMSRHDPCGSTLCIHSVCVEASQRRQGIAGKMLQAYLSMVPQVSPEVK